MDIMFFLNERLNIKAVSEIPNDVARTSKSALC